MTTKSHRAKNDAISAGSFDSVLKRMLTMPPDHRRQKPKVDKTVHRKKKQKPA